MIKPTIILVGLLLLEGCSHSPPKDSAPDLSEAKTRERLEAMAEYAYATGCYNAFIDFCTRFREIPLREKCVTEGLEKCEAQGKRFSAGLHGR